MANEAQVGWLASFPTSRDMRVSMESSTSALVLRGSARALSMNREHSRRAPPNGGGAPGTRRRAPALPGPCSGGGGCPPL